MLRTPLAFTEFLSLSPTIGPLLLHTSLQPINYILPILPSPASGILTLSFLHQHSNMLLFPLAWEYPSVLLPLYIPVYSPPFFTAKILFFFCNNTATLLCPSLLNSFLSGVCWHYSNPIALVQVIKLLLVAKCTWHFQALVTFTCSTCQTIVSSSFNVGWPFAHLSFPAMLSIEDNDISQALFFSDFLICLADGNYWQEIGERQKPGYFPSFFPLWMLSPTVIVPPLWFPPDSWTPPWTHFLLDWCFCCIW